MSPTRSTPSLALTSRAGILAALGGVCLSAGIAAADEEHTFQTDSGQYELGYIVLAPEAFIGNYYQTDNGDEFVIGSVEIALGFGLEGLAFEVIIYDDADNDGDPVNATVLSRTEATVAPDAPLFNVLNIQRVEIEPTTVSGGFFVGVWIKEQPFEGLVDVNIGEWWTAPSTFRVGHAARGTNWTVRPPLGTGMSGGNGPIDVVNLDQNFLVDQTQLNWVIRAEGVPAEGRISVDMNDDGSYDVTDVVAFLTMFQAGDADYNADGVTDTRDVLVFLFDWQNAG